MKYDRAIAGSRTKLTRMSREPNVTVLEAPVSGLFIEPGDDWDDEKVPLEFEPANVEV